jgi:hypothetical protein
MLKAAMNIDWPNALIGALVGWLLGFGFDRLILWSRRVKVEFKGFESVQTNFGILYKMRLELKGHEDPGECSCEIKINNYTTFAKWDETPNPLREDRLTEFVPEMVPTTFHQHLYVDREYYIPIIVKTGNTIFVFDGWWFGRSAGYYKQPPIIPHSILSMSVRGSGFVWSRTFTIEEIIGV